ncbi:MAG TPA: GTP pyrophosphokinase [Candidatus Aphodousia faecavium]|nr:GTP pyrophosphokinase [Candidatus Aphodousia faecavium]
MAQEEAKLPEFVKSQYELALKIATEAHKGQKDKGGANYILHPLKVAELCPHDICKVIALLHDVIEDCGLTTTELDEKGIYPIIHGRVKLLTRQEGQTYQEYLEAIAEDPYAREVKIADLTHNMDLSRIPNPTEKDFERVEKYKKALAFLRSINY